MKRLFREPLTHFLVLGAALFLVYRFIGDQPDNRPDKIVVTQGRIDSLKKGFVSAWQRDPTPAETNGLIRDYIVQEVSIREAAKLGLDRDDTVIRDRLAEKMDFLVRDTFRIPDPTEDDLKSYYDSHPSRFRLPARITLAQIVFNRDRRKDAKSDAQATLNTLANAGDSADLAQLGDGEESEFTIRSLEESAVSRMFGKEFTDAVFALLPGSWQGPIVSKVGFHLVRVSEIEPAKPLEFDAVRDIVTDLWREQRQRQNTDRYFSDLIKKYDVIDEDSNPFPFPPSNENSSGGGGQELKPTQ